MRFRYTRSAATQTPEKYCDLAGLCVLFNILKGFLNNAVNVHKLLICKARKINRIFNNNTQLKISKNFLPQQLKGAHHILSRNVGRRKVIAELTDAFNIIILSCDDFTGRFLILQTLGKQGNMTHTLGNRVVKLAGNTSALCLLNFH